MPLETIPEAACPILFEMARTGKCTDPTGKVHDFAGAVGMAYAHALYGLVRREKPQTIVEIGLMRGGSALAMLAALKKNEEEAGASTAGGGGGGGRTSGPREADLPRPRPNQVGLQRGTARHRPLGL